MFSAVENPPTATEWGLVEKCIERLKPLATATEQVEADGATLLTVVRYNHLTISIT
jgi:hypothetical protein